MRILIMILVGFSVLWGEHFWTNWRGNNRQDGLSPCIGPREPYLINWISFSIGKSKNCSISYQIQVEPNTSAVISEDSTLYVYNANPYTNLEKTYLFSIKNDNLQWREEFGDGDWGEQNICIDDEGILYFPYEDYYLVAYNGKERYIIWQKGEMDRGRAISTFVDKGIVYLMTGGKYVLAYNSKNGDLLWKEEVPYPFSRGYYFSYGDNGNIYFSNSDNLVVFKTDRTYRDLEAHYASSPSIAKDGTVYSVFEKRLFAITPDLYIKWYSEEMEDTTEEFHPCAIDNNGDIVCISHLKGNLYKFSSKNKLLWKKYLAENPCWSTIDAENKIFVFAGETNLFCFKPDGNLYYKIENLMHNGFNLLIGPGRRLYIISAGGLYIYGGQEGFEERTKTAKQIPAKLDIYPNPFKDKLTVNSTSEGAIYNIVGQSMHSFNKGKHVLDTQSWEQGVYVVKSGTETKKVVKVS